jgi:hypothetical protein
MALYKFPQFLQNTTDSAFDRLNEPGSVAPNPGIYRCEVCAREIAIALGHVLPSQNHHQHPQQQPIQWRLVVSHA